MSATDPKGGESRCNYPRDVYPLRGDQAADLPAEYEMQTAFERRIRIREVAAERERITRGLCLHDDDTGFCPGGAI